MSKIKIQEFNIENSKIREKSRTVVYWQPHNKTTPKEKFTTYHNTLKQI